MLLDSKIVALQTTGVERNSSDLHLHQQTKSPVLLATLQEREICPPPLLSLYLPRSTERANYHTGKPQPARPQQKTTTTTTRVHRNTQTGTTTTTTMATDANNNNNKRVPGSPYRRLQECDSSTYYCNPRSGRRSADRRRASLLPQEEEPTAPNPFGWQEWGVPSPRAKLLLVTAFTCNRNSTRSNNQPQPIQNFIESSHTRTQQHRLTAGVCWKKLLRGAGVLAS
jgi:hypothetical protein